MKQRVQINEFDKNIVQHNKYHTNKKQTSSSHHFFAKKSHKFRKLRFTFFSELIHRVFILYSSFPFISAIISLCSVYFLILASTEISIEFYIQLVQKKKSNWRKIQKIINNKHTQNPSPGFSKLCWFYFFFVLLIFYHKPSRL